MTEKHSTHKQLAVNCFNAAWDLLDLTDRTTDETEQMLHLAHTSFWHWTQVEEHTPKNLSIGYWQLSRVYATAQLGERALYFAQQCLDVSVKNEIEPFYIGYAYEALGRANSLLDQQELVQQHCGLALEFAEKVIDEGAKELLVKDVKSMIA